METYRGVVYPAQCDAMGHMNVQHYTAAFDQAMWHFVLGLGYLPSWASEIAEGWADVRYLINFKEELKVGSLFKIESMVRRVGRSSLTSFHRLTNAETGQDSADAEIVSVYFDLNLRHSKELPRGLREAAERLVGELET